MFCFFQVLFVRGMWGTATDLSFQSALEKGSWKISRVETKLTFCEKWDVASQAYIRSTFDPFEGI